MNKSECSVLFALVASASVMLHTFVISANMFSISTRIDSEIPVSTYQLFVVWIHPETPVSSGISVMRYFFPISMSWVAFALVSSIAKVVMIGADFMWVFANIVPFVLVRWVWAFWIDPEVVISCGITVITKLMAFAGVFFYTVVLSRSFDCVVADSLTSEVPLGINNTNIHWIHPELVSSWGITVIRRLKMISSWMTQTFVGMAMFKFLMVRADFICWINAIPGVKLVRRNLIFSVDPELVVPTGITVICQVMSEASVF